MERECDWQHNRFGGAHYELFGVAARETPPDRSYGGDNPVSSNAKLLEKSQFGQIRSREASTTGKAPHAVGFHVRSLASIAHGVKRGVLPE